MLHLPNKSTQVMQVYNQVFTWLSLPEVNNFDHYILLLILPESKEETDWSNDIKCEEDENKNKITSWKHKNLTTPTKQQQQCF